MTSKQTVQHKTPGFDNAKYLQLQKEEILKRVDLFSDGKLYLEIGGKLLWDPHASRVLPGFDPKVKVELFKDLAKDAELLFCVNADDITTDRQLESTERSYREVVEEMLTNFEEELGLRPVIVVNMIKGDEGKSLETFIKYFKNIGYTVYQRFFIQGYPEDTQIILSENGYGRDEYIETDKKLVLVTGAASNSGKMSTCLGQIYTDTQKDITSGYAKFETFPIWNLPLEHPLNLAYEAATADIGDYNVHDIFHRDAYGIDSVNYNRDVDAFVIIKKLSDMFLPKESDMRQYQSPTDMGINMAGYAITDDDICAKASVDEIGRRRGWYQEMVQRGDGEKEWVDRCEKLLTKAKKYSS